MIPQSNLQTAVQVSKATILWNAALSVFKFLAGIFAHSSAMLSDAIHSASDVFSTFIVIVGIKAAGKAADQSHPYGHERMECVAALLLAIVLFATGVGIGLSGFQKILISDGVPPVPPGRLALIAAVISIAVKETMYWYTCMAAKRIHSSALMADAWHHRSDALSSVGSLIGVWGARMGLSFLDPAAGIVICIFILKASVDIFMDAVNKMIDRGCDGATLRAIEEVIRKQNGVLGVDRIQTRICGDRIYVDVEIQSDGSSSLRQSHQIAQRVEDSVESCFPQVKHCMVHMNPSDDPTSRHVG